MNQDHPVLRNKSELLGLITAVLHGVSFSRFRYSEAGSRFTALVCDFNIL